MTLRHVNRRLFLLGAGGSALALPYLGSIVPRGAKAADLVRPRFIAIASDHGGVALENMWPDESMLTERTSLYGDHEIRTGALTARTDGARAVLSPVISASATSLTSALAAKLNVVRGLDIPIYIGHHTGGHLGNYAESSAGDVPSSVKQKQTIDQFLAASPSFYGRDENTRMPVLNLGADDGGLSISQSYVDPTRPDLGTAPTPTWKSSADLFEQLFPPPPPSTGVSRQSAISRVYESYSQLRGGAFGAAARLSSEDRRRLEAHMALVSELERKVTAIAACSPSPLGGVADSQHPGAVLASALADASEYWSIFNDLLFLAISCGGCRVATLHVMHLMQPQAYEPDWHQRVAHLTGDDPEAQARMTASQQAIFEHVFLDLARKLDVEEAEGKTYLDNTLIQWTQESGPITHDSYSIPVVTAGSAGGRLKTGRYADYRRKSTDIISTLRPDYPGIFYNRWLSTALTSLGIPSEEYGAQGYASNALDPRGLAEYPDRYPDRLTADAGVALPQLINET
jgi:Protein of unknown function (DUF1552)